ncbi:MAG: FdtA/QdtA family cupin domain-containing protein [Bacteroidales bacterium]|nr:FdtA/QdtA family cupin domain-containing protein [Bacteroidales bacterium]
MSNNISQNIFSTSETTIDDCHQINLPFIHRSRGNLTSINNGIDIPFNIERVYYLYDVPAGAERGGHAHSELHQYIVAAAGSFNVVLDDGNNIKTVSLNRPQKALNIVPGIWREVVDFSGGAICLVLASNHYNENEYIRDKSDFYCLKKSCKKF